MMDSYTGQTFFEEMQPNFDALPERLKNEKLRNHMTNLQLSDVSGVPIATTSRILSGAVSNPGFFHIVALCAAMGVSMDSVAGVHPVGGQAEIDRLRQELAHKDEMIIEKDAAIDRLLDRSRIMEAGVAARDERIRKQNAEMKNVRSSYKILVYGLCGVCITLTFVWAIYVILDSQTPDHGLIRSDNVSPVVWIGGAAVIVLLFGLLHFTVSKLSKKRDTLWEERKKSRG